MKLQLHRDSGLSIRDAVTKEEIYADSFENAVVDAELEAMAWPDEQLVRIFTLSDGRVAVVRETAAGLRQEAASSSIQQFVAALTQQVEKMQAAQAGRMATEQSEDSI